MKQENQTPTIHNAARLGDIAKIVLMPGDPVRAAYIAKHFLRDARQVSDIRGIGAYTGSYQGTEVSVMASGMGCSSMSIYSRELYDFYGVEAIIRVGSAGGLSNNLKLGDIVIAQSASTDSSYPSLVGFYGSYSPTASFALLSHAAQICTERGFPFSVGPVFTGEAFYYPDATFTAMARMGMLAVEMETAALYTNAALAGQQALTLCTVADMMFTGEKCTPKEREETFSNMILTALELSGRVYG